MAFLPVLHPIHASSDGGHLLLWLVMGAGIGIAVVMAAWLARMWFPAGPADDSQPPGPPPE